MGSMVLKALMVTSDADAASVLARALAELEIQSEVCEGPAAAQTYLTQQRFDALFLDWVDGASALVARVRNTPRHRRALIIALANDRAAAASVFAAGANLLIYKPISADLARPSLRAARSLMKRERRRTARVAASSKVTLEAGRQEGVPARLLDVSEEGAGIQCDRPLTESGKVYLQFTLPGQAEEIRASGRVVRVFGKNQIGIEFSGLPQRSSRILRDWLQQELSQLESPLAADRAGANRNSSDQPLPDPGGSERRSGDRQPCHLGAEIYRAGSTVPHHCTLRDLGTGGCYVETPMPFPAETAVEVVVRAPAGKVKSRGVVHLSDPGFGMGVQFTPTTAQERSSLMGLLNTLGS
jgi:CheY-like chemotaxis protein